MAVGFGACSDGEKTTPGDLAGSGRNGKSSPACRAFLVFQYVEMCLLSHFC